jgi:hypothetical protein
MVHYFDFTYPPDGYHGKARIMLTVDESLHMLLHK